MTAQVERLLRLSRRRKPQHVLRARSTINHKGPAGHKQLRQVLERLKRR